MQKITAYDEKFEWMSWKSHRLQISFCMSPSKDRFCANLIAQNLTLLSCVSESSCGMEGHRKINFDYSPNWVSLMCR